MSTSHPDTHAAIVADLVKALESARDGVRFWRDNAVVSAHDILDAKLAEIDTVLARAKQLDLDSATVHTEHFYGVPTYQYLRIPMKGTEDANV